jgi:hypothetical protein
MQQQGLLPNRHNVMDFVAVVSLCQESKTSMHVGTKGEELHWDASKRKKQGKKGIVTVTLY